MVKVEEQEGYLVHRKYCHGKSQKFIWSHSRKNGLNNTRTVYVYVHEDPNTNQAQHKTTLLHFIFVCLCICACVINGDYCWNKVATFCYVFM